MYFTLWINSIQFTSLHRNDSNDLIPKETNQVVISIFFLASVSDFSFHQKYNLPSYLITQLGQFDFSIPFSMKQAMRLSFEKVLILIESVRVDKNNT